MDKCGFLPFLFKVFLSRFTPILFSFENWNRFTLTFKLFKAKKNPYDLL
ncbi:hypothetical protein LEP1GSC188_1502 [Leptospira weilii serovar Topaz str. LT2116]|uniref:Uncharacterized protein n=1 Tax=Leptospira weilii serovar Topaz str. LT2116 TaxID=1088540 RepID=M3GTB5_9LEPT|nr:hypothetical protein LEP1GSC188_1502 [Leptospira weilii serovar Topaz str. LT2116]